MRTRSVAAGTVLLGSLLAAGWLQAENAPTAAEYAQWRADRAAGLTKPYGWFTLVALDWLKPGVTTVGSAKDNTVVLPGTAAHLLTLTQAGGTVTVTAAAAGATSHGKPLAPGQPLSKDEKDDSAVIAGGVRMWVIDRGGKQYLRVKDANAPALKNFRGLQWYGVTPHFRVEARWVPFATPHTLHFLNQLGQESDEVEPGQAEFTIDGKRCTLTPLEATDKELFFVMRDLTSAKDTDQGGRFLVTDPPSNGLKVAGTVVLDFNFATNPPCAYSPFATCPLAAGENRLPVAIPAGEKRYGD